MIADLIARNMDWPGAEATAERLRRLLPPGLDGQAPEPSAPSLPSASPVPQEPDNRT